MLEDQRTAMYLIQDRMDGPSSVVNHTLAIHTDGGQVPGYAIINESTVDPALVRRMKKGRSSLKKVLTILDNGRIAASQSHPCAEQEHNVKVLQESVISFPGPREAKASAEMFTGMQLPYPNGYTSTSYLHTRVDSVLSTPTSPRTPNFASNESTNSLQWPSVVIHTGMCMFSRCTLAADLAIPPVPKGVAPTLYELEIVARLSATIADIVGRLNDYDTMIIVSIDIPDFQYYWRACSLLETGLVNVDYVQSWMAAMDLRNSQLGRVIASMIRSALSQRGLNDSNVVIRLNSGTEEAVALFKTKIAAGIVPTVREVVTALSSHGPEARQWQQFFTTLPLAGQPSTMDELGKLVYVFKTVKSALIPNVTSTTLPSGVTQPAGQNLIVQVNDITDWRIYDRSVRFLKAYSKIQDVGKNDTTLVGVFPLQSIFLARHGRSSLYEEHSSGEYMCEKRSVWPLSGLSVINQAYGSVVARQLRDSLDGVFVLERSLYRRVGLQRTMIFGSMVGRVDIFSYCKQFCLYLRTIWRTYRAVLKRVGGSHGRELLRRIVVESGSLMSCLRVAPSLSE